MSAGRYVLEGREPKVEPDLLTWARWFEGADRQVAETHVGPFRVSTVFLGLDHRFVSEGPPILFETMVFGRKDAELNGEMQRYSTWEDAERGHQAICRRVMEAVETK